MLYHPTVRQPLSLRTLTMARLSSSLSVQSERCSSLLCLTSTATSEPSPLRRGEGEVFNFVGHNGVGGWVIIVVIIWDERTCKLSFRNFV